MNKIFFYILGISILFLLGVSNAYASQSITMTSPTNNASFTVPASITMTVSYSDSSGTVTRVDYYAGALYLGEATSSPFTFTYNWTNNSQTGSYALTAVAHDSNSNSFTSPVVSITINPHTAPSVNMTSPANNASFVTGSNIGLTATASVTAGTISKVDFYYNGTYINTIYSSPYSLTWNNVQAGSYNMTAKATDSYGWSTTSSAVAITVGAATAPNITSQPVSVSVVAPATATFTVSAAGIPTPTYQWKQEPSGGTSYSNISGATSASYTTGATSTSNSGTKYECVVTNSAGNVTSVPATLTVTSSPVAPTITTQPTNATVLAPATATFTVAASGSPSPTYQWKQEAPGAGSFTAISGATGTSYTTPATSGSNNGTQYECVVINSAGSATSNAATLTVNTPVVPSITTQPSNVSVAAPATATFTVVATGTPTPTYQWMQEAPGGGSFTTISGATSASYTTPATTASNNGTQYECVVTNSAGSVTSNVATLTIVSPTISLTAPTNNSNFTVPASINMTVSYSDPGNTITRVDYYAGSLYLGEATSSPFNFTYNWNNNSQTGPYALTAVAHDGNSNSFTSSAINITVNPHTAPTVSIVTPTNNASFVTGSNVGLTANASVTAGTISKVDYYDNGTYINTAYSSPWSITWNNVQNGTYNLTAKATDSFGWSTTSSAVGITVAGAMSPSITTQPVNTTVTAPATATFTISATGNPTPTYQWMQEVPGGGSFTSISGATSASYTTGATTTANSCWLPH